jgi:hypothetical protein
MLTNVASFKGKPPFALRLALKASMRLAVATTESSMSSSSCVGEENNKDEVPGAAVVRFPAHRSRNLAATRCCAKPLATS